MRSSSWAASRFLAMKDIVYHFLKHNPFELWIGFVFGSGLKEDDGFGESSKEGRSNYMVGKIENKNKKGKEKNNFFFFLHCCNCLY
jgi:hypothetical protein